MKEIAPQTQLLLRHGHKQEDSTRPADKRARKEKQSLSKTLEPESLPIASTPEVKNIRRCNISSFSLTIRRIRYRLKVSYKKYVN